MTGVSVVALLMDVVIAALLAVTIFYAARLSLMFRVFRESRTEIDRMILSLSRDITRAETAVQSLSTAARERGKELDERLIRARELSDELEIIVEAGDRLASRLEVLASSGRSATMPIHVAPSAVAAPAPSVSAEPSRRRTEPVFSEPVASSVGTSFAIRDPDFDLETGLLADDEAGDAFGDDVEVPDTLTSQAERELYAALQRGRQGGGRR